MHLLVLCALYNAALGGPKCSEDYGMVYRHYTHWKVGALLPHSVRSRMLTGRCLLAHSLTGASHDAPRPCGAA
jgi:hypothetical protein